MPFWRATFKDRRLGLWAILVHFFEKADGEGGKKAQRKERDGRLASLGGLMLRVVEAEWHV